MFKQESISARSVLARISAAGILFAILLSSAVAYGQAHYVVANDDSSFPATGVSFYTVAANGSLKFLQRVSTGGFGIGGGYFGADRISVRSNSKGDCVYASEASTGDIVGVDITTLTATAGAKGSSTDGGTSNGIGLAMNDNYLYASFTDSSTIGTFRVHPNCSLTFVNDTVVLGSVGGTVNGMAVRKNLLVVTYTDGSVESFDLTNGPPVSHGDKQFTTAFITSHGASYANSIDITSDGQYAIFGDTSTSLMVEVSKISSGSLTTPRLFQSAKGINSSNVMLSPDENLLYVADTQGGSISALFFNKDTGRVTPGCTSATLRGLSGKWSYLGTLAPLTETGNGGGVYVAEFGSASGIGMVRLTLADGGCTLVEPNGSPFADPNSPGLLSIGTFPPRSF